MIDKINRFIALGKLFFRLSIVFFNPFASLFLNQIIIDIWREARRLNPEDTAYVPIEQVELDSEDSSQVKFHVCYPFFEFEFSFYHFWLLSKIQQCQPKRNGHQMTHQIMS